MLQDDLPRRLARGMTYEDFQEEYGMDVVEADRAIANLKHDYDIERERRGDTWEWILAEPEDIPPLE